MPNIQSYSNNNLPIPENETNSRNHQQPAETLSTNPKETTTESDYLISAFLNNISHEIRTPLNAIVGFCSLLKTETLTTDLKEKYIDIILDSSDRLLSTIDDIIAISKIETNQINISRNKFNINLLIKLLYAKFITSALKQNLVLNFETQLPDGNDLLVSDKMKLEAILSNLLSNAIKFTQKGEITFGYRVQDSFLEFFVEDTGIGIPPEMQEIIFKPFRQVEYKHTRYYRGSGLGLSIAKAYVEILGGKINLSSEPGKGSRFFFNIPNTKPTETSQALPPENTENL